MANIQTYIDKFFFVGSTENVQTKQKEVLAKLLSWEEQILSPEQILQVVENLGIYNLLNKNGSVALIKGLRTITFDNAFTAAYAVIATGATATAPVAVRVVDWSNLGYFTIYVPVDCTVSWTAGIIRS